VLIRKRLDGRLQCVACAHRCALADGQAGVCGVRFRRGDTLRAPFGYVAASRIMPVERNTIFHVRPGAAALTFGMLGCDLRCPYCSNWQLSQALREEVPDAAVRDVSPDGLADEAVAAGCRVLCSAFNEPMITAEWAYAVFSEARGRGLVTALISDGNTTEEALAVLRPVTDVYRVDLKGYAAAQYRTVGGDPDAPIAALRTARRLGYWVEAVTMVVPGFNDDPGGLRALATSIAAIDPDVPWHLNGFVPRYRMADRPPMDAGPLVSAAGIGYARGLRHVYVGNVADRVTELSHSRCPRCHHVVVRRENYTTLWIGIRNGACPYCGTIIPGRWE
jgi:pyruvate formate lyase activating enzyme